MKPYDDLYAAIQRSADLLHGSEVVAGPYAMQRGYADSIEGHLVEKMCKCLKESPGLDAQAARTKRSVEDFCIRGEGITVWIDVKTKDQAGTFSMPNLISIERLWKIFQSPVEALVFLFADYSIVDKSKGTARIDDLLCVPAESMNPKLLHIQNLGLGQLQMRPDATGRELLVPSAGQNLYHALPDMAAQFHMRQMEKSRRQAEAWAGRRVAAS